jgi:hypothetical protein
LPQDLLDHPLATLLKAPQFSAEAFAALDIQGNPQPAVVALQSDRFDVTHSTFSPTDMPVQAVHWIGYQVL